MTSEVSVAAGPAQALTERTQSSKGIMPFMSVPEVKKNCFPLEERLKRRNEIREVFDKGKRTGCRGAKLFVLKNNLCRNRICFTFSRSFGTAVERNRARRLGREAYRNLRSRLRCGYDLILLVYPEDNQTFAGRMEQLEYLFTRAGLL